MDSSIAAPAADIERSPVVIALPAERETPQQIILSIEPKLKDLISSLTNKGIKKEGDNPLHGIKLEEELLEKLPSSMTGVMIYYFLRGIKEDFNIELNKEPTSMRKGGGGIKRVATRNVMEMTPEELDSYIEMKKEEYLEDSSKGKIMSNSAKNQLLKDMNMSNYDIPNSISMEDVMAKIQKAYEIKGKLENAGYILPTASAKRPEWQLD
jgi:hypothetical protein